MSTSSATAAAARTIAATPKKSEKKVMKELEKKLKGKLSPVNGSPKISAKPLTVKQVINENMLAARARWLTQNRDKDEEIDITSSMSCVDRGSGSGESDVEEVRERRLALSHEPSRIHQVDNNNDTQTEPRGSRAFSSSFPNGVPKTLQCPPPLLSYPGGTSSSTTSKAAVVASGPKIYRGGKQQSKDGTKKPSSVSSTGSAVKKLFGFKPKKKRKRTRKMTRIAPTRVGSVKGEGSEKKDGGGGEESAVKSLEKSVSDSALVIQKVRAFTSSAEDEMILVPCHGYQNVFDNPQFAKYTQQHQQKHESRSDTSSPSDNTTLLQAKKPKPLPRPCMPGSTMGRLSVGSDQESELEMSSTTLSIPPLIISPNSASSDGLTHDLIDGVEGGRVRYLHGSDGSLGEHSERSNCSHTKEKLAMTLSYNPGATGWNVVRRESSRKQKDLRRGICSDGDQIEIDLEDEYIDMKSISLFKDNQLKSDPTDTDRESAYYLEILPNRHGFESKKNPPPTKAHSKMGTSFGESKGSVLSERQPRVAKQLHKTNTVPAINIHGMKNENTPTVLDIPELQEGPAEDRNSTRSATPPKASTTASAKSDKQELLKPSKRKFQYTSVMVEAGNQNKLSSPNKFRYQTVTLGSENEKFKVAEEEEEELYETLTTPTEGQVEERRESVDVDSRDRLQPATKHHPLVNLSSGTRRSPMRSVEAERSYYVNRDSLVVTEASMNWHSTMLSTVDPATGKVVWHEYIEMDEDQIDSLATSIGMVKSAPIPDKLEALLNFKPNEQPCENGFKGTIEDLNHSCSSASSISSKSMCTLNPNEPPTIPSRPENLDALVDQLKERSSGDYSYAFIPSMGDRWKMSGGKISTRSPTSAPNNSTPAMEDVVDKRKEGAAAAPWVKTSISASKSVQPGTNQKIPPSLPPRSESLLREQVMVKGQLKTKSNSQPYVLPIIVKTKEKKQKTKTFLPSKTSPNLLLSPDIQKPLGHGSVSSTKDDTQVQDYQSRRKITPPKPIPYKEHQKKRLQGQKATPAPLLIPDSLIKLAIKKSVRRSKAHKKLIRQRSHKGRVSYRKAEKQPANETNLDGDSWRQKTNAPRGSELDLNDSLNKESFALLMQNQDAITKELFSGTELEHNAEGDESVLEKNEIESSQKARDLSNILEELRHLLKSSNFTEKDILSAIESHLKLTLGGDTPSDSKPPGNGNDEEEDSDENEEEEDWMSGDEPESDIEVGEISETKSNQPTSNARNRPFYINFQIRDEELEAELANEPEEPKSEKEQRFLSSSEYDKEEDGNTHSYINRELWTGVKSEFVNSDLETNLDRAVRSPRTPVPSSKENEREVSPYDSTSAAPTKHTSNSTSSSSDSFLAEHRERSMTDVSHSLPMEIQQQSPRSHRSQSNPNVELVNAAVAAGTKPRPQKNRAYLEEKRSEKTFSYCLALEMEDRYLSQAAEVSTSRRFSGVKEGETCLI